MLPCKNPCPHQSPQTVQQPLLQPWTYGTLYFNINTWKSLFSSLYINCKWLFPSLSNLSIKIGNRYFPRCQWIILQGDLQAEGGWYCGLWQLANYARQVGLIFFVFVNREKVKQSSSSCSILPPRMGEHGVYSWSIEISELMKLTLKITREGFVVEEGQDGARFWCWHR